MFIYLTELAVSAVVVISHVAAKEERFTIRSFPPRICENKNNNVYDSILPKSVVGALVTGMLVIIGWVIYKVKWTSTQIAKVCKPTYII